MLLLPARSWWLLSRSELSAPCISSDAPSSSSSLSMLLARLSPSHMCAGSASPSSVSSRSVVWFAARYGCSCCGCSARWKPKGSRKVSANIPTLPTRDCSANNVSPSPESSISASSTCEPSQRDRKNKRKTTGRIRAATPPLPSPVLHHAVGSTPCVATSHRDHAKINKQLVALAPIVQAPIAYTHQGQFHLQHLQQLRDQEREGDVDHVGHNGDLVHSIVGPIEIDVGVGEGAVGCETKEPAKHVQWKQNRVHDHHHRPPSLWMLHFADCLRVQAVSTEGVSH
eukprot:scaffold140_cov565-Prasinococcus_capsulatus_cf.AAC.29